MNAFEWIFGKNEKEELTRIHNSLLANVQEAVDIYHVQLDRLCGSKAKNECGDCYHGDIPEDEEWLYDRCPNYQDRCSLRSRLNSLCEKLRKESLEEMKKVFYECRCFIWRPLFRKIRLELDEEEKEKL